MKYEDIISIVVPVYNVSSFLDICVESICAQTYDNLEIILVDDGSTDDSGLKCDRWKEKDSRIVVIHRENGGISNARNDALDVAKGQYIGFVDSDDTIVPEMYEVLYQMMKQSKTKMVVGGYEMVNSNDEPYPKIFSNVPQGVLDVEQYIGLIHQNPRYHCELSVVWSKLYERTLIGEERFRVGVIHEDEFFLNAILKKLDKIAVVDAPLYHYLKRQSSVMGNMNKKFSERNLVYYEAMKERISLCETIGCGQECTNQIKRETVDVGIKYWLLSHSEKIGDKASRRSFYNDIRKLGESGIENRTKKDCILWWLFSHTPSMLKDAYCLYRKIKSN